MYTKTSRKAMMVATIACLGMLISLGTVATGASAEEARTVKVGWWTDQTGPLADAIGDMLKGGQDYFRYVNEELGGIKGKGGTVKVEMLWVDHKSNPTIALEAYERWRTDKDLVITHASLSSIVLAAEDKLEADKIPCLYQAGSLNVVMDPIRDYIYMSGFPRDMVIAGLVDWILENNKGKEPPKMAVIAVDQGWAKHSMNEGGGIKYAQARGVSVVKKLVVPTFPTDTTAELREINQAGADFIYGTFCQQTGAIVLKDAYRMGLKIPIIMDQCNAGPEIVEKLGPAAEGVYLTPAIRIYEGLSRAYWNPGLENMKKIYEKYNPGKKLADTPSYPNGYRQALLIRKIIEMALDKVSAQNLNGEALKRYGIDAMKGFTCEGLNGPMGFPPDTHVGLDSMQLLQVKGGEIQVVLDWVQTPFVTDTKLIESPYLKPGNWKDLLE